MVVSTKTISQDRIGLKMLAAGYPESAISCSQVSRLSKTRLISNDLESQQIATGVNSASMSGAKG